MKSEIFGDINPEELAPWVSKYTQSSASGDGPKIRTVSGQEYSPVVKVGSFEAEWDMPHHHLEKHVRKMAIKFLEDMEKQGFYWMKGTPVKLLSNADGTVLVRYALDWEAAQSADIAPHAPQSLEDAKGMLEYRIVAAFWGPMVQSSIIVPDEHITEMERMLKNPTQFKT